MSDSLTHPHSTHRTGSAVHDIVMILSITSFISSFNALALALLCTGLYARNGCELDTHMTRCVSQPFSPPLLFFLLLFFCFSFSTQPFLPTPSLLRFINAILNTHSSLFIFHSSLCTIFRALYQYREEKEGNLPTPGDTAHATTVLEYAEKINSSTAGTHRILSTLLLCFYYVLLFRFLLTVFDCFLLAVIHVSLTSCFVFYFISFRHLFFNFFEYFSFSLYLLHFLIPPLSALPALQPFISFFILSLLH